MAVLFDPHLLVYVPDEIVLPMFLQIANAPHFLLPPTTNAIVTLFSPATFSWRIDMLSPRISTSLIAACIFSYLTCDRCIVYAIHSVHAPSPPFDVF